MLTASRTSSTVSSLSCAKISIRVWLLNLIGFSLLSFHFDQILGLCSMVKLSLGQAELLQESIELSYRILVEVGENLPRSMDDDQFSIDVQKVNSILQNTSDDEILDMKLTNDKKVATLLKLYSYLVHALHFAKPSLGASVSLRMVGLTLEAGLAAVSPLAFAYYGEFLTSVGSINEGCRLG